MAGTDLVGLAARFLMTVVAALGLAAFIALGIVALGHDDLLLASFCTVMALRATIVLADLLRSATRQVIGSWLRRHPAVRRTRP
ncbi:hypothetical protein ACFFMN_23890 [Planobispora siamensis]|uniref:Uncharacterized protein n=1 Tax=Planobispora siamensis TaxID=936338 RepID=A0A8J3SN58_9ACTN|nr:hypothetical protein [Planobispora siamensis]GIH95379.1 hypothetical protein Psi01_60090 [Planobispora siamensis]